MYQKIKVKFDFSTHISSSNRFIKQFDISGTTGSIGIQLSTAIVTKMKRMVHNFIPIPDIERDIRIERRKKFFKRKTADIAGTMSRKGLGHLIQNYEKKMVIKLTFFTHFEMKDLQFMKFYQKKVKGKDTLDKEEVRLMNEMARQNAHLQQEYLIWRERIRMNDAIKQKI